MRGALGHRAYDSVVNGNEKGVSRAAGPTAHREGSRSVENGQMEPRKGAGPEERAAAVNYASSSASARLTLSSSTSMANGFRR